MLACSICDDTRCKTQTHVASSDVIKRRKRRSGDDAAFFLLLLLLLFIVLYSHKIYYYYIIYYYYYTSANNNLILLFIKCKGRYNNIRNQLMMIKQQKNDEFLDEEEGEIEIRY